MGRERCAHGKGEWDRQRRFRHTKPGFVPPALAHMTCAAKPPPNNWTRGGGATPQFWTPTTPPTNCWPEAPWGGHWRGGSGRGGGGGGGSRRGWGGGGGGGGLREGRLGGGSRWGESGWWGGGSRWGDLGCWGGGGGAQAPLTSPCPPSNHTITINLTLTFAAS